MLLLKVLPVEATRPYTRRSILNVFAVMSEGSFASLIDEELAEKLGVTGDAQKITLNWIGNHKKVVPSIKCRLKVRTIEGKTIWLPLTGSRVQSLELPVQSLDIESFNEKCTKLTSLPIKGYGYAKPSILIGMENGHLIKTLQSV